MGDVDDGIGSERLACLGQEERIAAGTESVDDITDLALVDLGDSGDFAEGRGAAYIASAARLSDSLEEPAGNVPLWLGEAGVDLFGVAVQQYEATLAERLLEALADRPRFKVWGITDRRRLAERVPTISITMEGRTVAEIAEHLAARQIYAWHGNMYALELTERLRLEERGGFLRLGLVHYNTAEEIDGLIQALDAF